jgi:hypothetical protein
MTSKSEIRAHRFVLLTNKEQFQLFPIQLLERRVFDLVKFVVIRRHQYLSGNFSSQPHQSVSLPNIQILMHCSPLCSYIRLLKYGVLGINTMTVKQKHAFK